MGSDRTLTWDQYAVQWRAHDGGYDLRRVSRGVRLWLRLAYWLARALAAARIGPGVVTLAGVALAAAVPLVCAGRSPTGLLVASGLVVLSALARAVALAVGVLTGQAGPRSGIRQAAGDRLSELAWLAGFWAGGAPGSLIVVTAVVTWLYAHVRELGLAAGMSRASAQAAGGRPAWPVLAIVGLALAGLSAGIHGPLSGGLLAITAVVWLLLTVAGLGQLAGAIRRSLV